MFYKLEQEFPEINWDEFNAYEGDDQFMVTGELACVNGSCEII